jgi:hypothetical protein
MEVIIKSSLKNRKDPKKVRIIKAKNPSKVRIAKTEVKISQLLKQQTEFIGFFTQKLCVAFECKSHSSPSVILKYFDPIDAS